VGDPQLVQPARPLLQLRPVGAAEGDVVQADPVLAEGLIGRGRPVLVQAEQGVAAEQVHGVVEVGVGVLVQHRLGAEQRLVPGDADGQVADGDGDVGDGWEVGHGCSFPDGAMGLGAGLDRLLSLGRPDASAWGDRRSGPAGPASGG
jgi:hypothetical protein